MVYAIHDSSWGFIITYKNLEFFLFKFTFMFRIHLIRQEICSY